MALTHSRRSIECDVAFLPQTYNNTKYKLNFYHQESLGSNTSRLVEIDGIDFFVVLATLLSIFLDVFELRAAPIASKSFRLNDLEHRFSLDLSHTIRSIDRYCDWQIGEQSKRKKVPIINLSIDNKSMRSILYPRWWRWWCWWFTWVIVCGKGSRPYMFIRFDSLDLDWGSAMRLSINCVAKSINRHRV